MSFLKMNDPIISQHGDESGDDKDDSTASTTTPNDGGGTDIDTDSDDSDEDDSGPLPKKENNEDDYEKIDTKLFHNEIQDEGMMDPLEYDDDDDDDDDDTVLQKLDEYVVEDLEKLHPEIKCANNEEIEALTRVIRNNEGKIIDPLHRTLPFLTKYEKTRIVGSRAEQIERGAIPFVKVDSNIINGRTIALLELEQKKIPFIIARPLPNKTVEYWKLQDLEIL